MLAAERRTQILEKLQTEKRVVVSELSRLFDVSEETIRRDLEKLEKEGKAIKGYGGAILCDDSNIDLPFNVRKKRNVPGKKMIASLCQDLVQDGEHIILDASTTSVFIARALKNKKKLTVITNSIEVIAELADTPGWDIISTGGRLMEGYMTLVGPGAVEALKAYNVEKTIFSCKGLHMEKGITDNNEMFALTKREMQHSATQSILAVDSTKFDVIAFSRICDARQVDIVITDQRPEERWMEFFAEAGIDCRYPE